MEILSPAGSLEALVAAVNSGCDAVYLGGKQFSARSFANNFSTMELEKAIDYCHERQVKVLITVNTLYKDDELPFVLSFLKKMYAYGADGFIMQDLGVFNAARQNFPLIEYHASTQMTAHSLEDAQMLERWGFSRVVLSRELSLKQVAHISKNTALDTEVFVHGALCVCVSGQCYMSSAFGERSGNRGRCAQPCRLPFHFHNHDGYLLSPKDLMALKLMPKLAEAGVKAGKIEGRMKSPEYVKLTTQIYSNSAIMGELEEKMLAQIFCRGGEFTEGYLVQEDNRKGAHMISRKTPKSLGIFIGVAEGGGRFTTLEPLVPGDGIAVLTARGVVGEAVQKHFSPGDVVYFQKAVKKGDSVYKCYDKHLVDRLKKDASLRKIIVTCNVRGLKDTPLEMTLTVGDISVHVAGDVLQQAKSKPGAERILSQISKTGDTPFTIVFGDVALDDDIYMPVVQINALRREACGMLSAALTGGAKREIGAVVLPSVSKAPGGEKKFTVSLSHPGQLQGCLQPGIHRVYVEASTAFDIQEISKQVHSIGAELWLALPHFEPNPAASYPESDGYLIRTMGQLQRFDKKVKKALDYNFHVTNSLTLGFLSQYAESVTLSPELNLKELTLLADKRTEIIVHGRQRLMITKQCPVGNYLNCKPGRYELQDRKQLSFPVLTDCENCLAFIHNSKILFTADKPEVFDVDAGFFRIAFTTESAEEVAHALSCYLHGNKYEHPKDMLTYGHFFRGVE